MTLITLHARQEPTTNPETLSLWPNTKSKDTVLYEDEGLTRVKARIPWHHRNRPVSRKTTMLNCWRWRFEWHPAI